MVQILKLPRDPARDEREFLPAALEIVETPPSPTARALAAALIVLFCLALAWVCLGQVDIIASAPGKVVPTGRSKVIQPFETGVVRAIHVRDGQAVKAGDLLIELDPTINASERNHALKELVAARLDIARLRAILSPQAKEPVANAELAFVPPAGADAAQVAMQRHYLASQLAEQHAKLAALDGQITQKERERETISAAINKLEAMIPIAQKRLDIRVSLKDFSSKLTYLETLQQLTDVTEDLKVQQARYREASAAIVALVQSRAQTAAEFDRKLYGEQADAERKAAGFEEDLAKFEQKTKLDALRSPVDGVVQQLAIHTVNGVVTPAQALLVVVPADSRLEIEAMVSNRDIGFVREGQMAQVKIDTFNFTRYGLLQGQVLSVSSDAISRERTQDGRADRARSEDPTSEPSGQTLAYSARIGLDQTQMQIEDRLVSLSPGMAVTVEIHTGSRRLINYLLSPLLKYSHESMRER